MARVALSTNVPFPELTAEGWGQSVTARQMRPVEVLDGKNVESPLPFGYWREPNTGVIMLLPSTVSALVTTTPEYEAGIVVLGDLVPSPDIWAFNQMRILATKRQDSGSNLVEALITNAILAVWDKASREVGWVAETTEPLHLNEGFGVTITPQGLMDELAEYWFVVAFGERYTLSLSNTGQAVLEYNADGTAYREVARYSIGDAGINLRKPISLTVLPWGPHYISILFDQTERRDNLMGGGSTTQKHTAFLFDLKKAGIDAPWLSEQNTYQKTPAGKLAVGLQLALWNYAWSITRIRYVPAIKPLVFGPYGDRSEALETAPSVQWYGFQFDYDGTLPGIGTVTPSLLGEDGQTALDPSTDTKAYLKFTMAPSSDNRYSPELWGYGLDQPSRYVVPSTTPVDISDKWTLLRYRESAAESGATQLEIKLEGYPVLGSLYQLGRPVAVDVLSADGLVTTALFEGYTERPQPTVSGPNLIVQNEMHCYGMWTRLDHTPIDEAPAVDGKSLGEVIDYLLKRAGFGAEHIVFTNQLDFLLLPLSPTEEPGEQRNWNQNTTCGDALRWILKQYSIQDAEAIRIRWKSGAWRVYFAPGYEAGVTPITQVFVLDDSLIPLISGRGRTDLERWNPDGETYGTQRFYRVTTDPEWTIGRPLYNELRCVCTDGTGADAGKVVARVAARPEVLGDPSSFFYEGIVRCATVGPPEIDTTDTEEVQRIARYLYDQAHRNLIELSFEAEWQPEIDVDQFAMVVGRNAEGDAVSFGAFRVVSLDAELTRDVDGQQFEWSANYALSYVGATTDLNFPMFSEVVPG